jgi:hypothetical protein
LAVLKHINIIYAPTANRRYVFPKGRGRYLSPVPNAEPNLLSGLNQNSIKFLIITDPKGIM